jgi:hypothetical protein
MDPSVTGLRGPEVLWGYIYIVPVGTQCGTSCGSEEVRQSPPLRRTRCHSAARAARYSAPATPCAHRGTNPPTWQRARGEVATKTNHVFPLAHFGAIFGVCDGGVVRTDHHNAGERSGSTQQHDLNEGPPCICWWLVKVKPITGQAPPTHSRHIRVSKGKLHI